MTEKLFLSRWMEAFAALQIWNPALWDYYPNIKRQKQLKLFYKCKGIVYHDRIWNGERR